MADPLYVPRPDVAARIAGLLNPDPLLGDMSGLFLAAPRRTGKSTFLRGDLMPRLEAEGKLVLYVDLWSSTKTDPGQLITGCIAGGLERSDGLIAKFRRNVPFSSVGALGFLVDLKASGSWEGTIPDALTLLVQATGKDVVMIVDEAQHSLVSEDGKSAMFALKAARDAVNQNNLPGHLYLIMTGSHRDKLAALVQDQQAPFYGASVRDFPTLGPEYTRALTEHLNKRFSANARLNPEVVEEADCPNSKGAIQKALDALREKGSCGARASVDMCLKTQRLRRHCENAERRGPAPFSKTRVCTEIGESLDLHRLRSGRVLMISSHPLERHG